MCGEGFLNLVRENKKAGDQKTPAWREGAKGGVGRARSVDRSAAVVREEEIHGTYDREAIGAGAIAFRIAQGGGNGAGAVHGLLAMLFEHQFREKPGLLVVIHHTLRPGPFPVAELGPFHQIGRGPDVTGRTETAEIREISN